MIAKLGNKVGHPFVEPLAIGGKHGAECSGAAQFSFTDHHIFVDGNRSENQAAQDARGLARSPAATTNLLFRIWPAER